jgi:hypothetical protein
MPDTLMAEATQHRALRHVKGVSVPFVAKRRSSSAMPSSPLRRLTTADRAFVVQTRWPAHQRTCLLQRTEGLPAVTLVGFLARPAVANMGCRKLRRLANRLNRRNGVSAAAAGAMYLDWRHEYEVSFEPTDPIDWAQFTRDRRAERRARDGEHTNRPVSSGYLRIKSTYLDYSRPIWPDSIRHSWLMAHFETQRADTHGRYDWIPVSPDTPPGHNGMRPCAIRSSHLSRLLPIELAAHRVNEAARAHSNVLASLHPFSRWRERQCRINHDPEAQKVKARRGSREHREAVKEAWAKSRPALRALLAAIRAYKRARAKLKTA